MAFRRKEKRIKIYMLFPYSSGAHMVVDGFIYFTLSRVLVPENLPQLNYSRKKKTRLFIVPREPNAPAQSKENWVGKSQEKNWTTGAKKKMIWHQMNRKDLSLLSAKVSFVGFDVVETTKGT